MSRCCCPRSCPTNWPCSPTWTRMWPQPGPQIRSDRPDNLQLRNVCGPHLTVRVIMTSFYWALQVGADRVPAAVDRLGLRIRQAAAHPVRGVSCPGYRCLATSVPGMSPPLIGREETLTAGGPIGARP
jgi:hypothetical protein